MSNFFTFVFDGGALRERDVSLYFRKGDLAKYADGKDGLNVLVNMDADTFLGLAEPIPPDDAERHERTFCDEELIAPRSWLVPYLIVRMTEDGLFKVVGHDGRHRVLILKKRGYGDIPVRMRLEAPSQFTWDTVVNHIKERPKWLWCQNDRSAEREQYRFKFPVTNANVGKEYRLPNGSKVS